MNWKFILFPGAVASVWIYVFGIWGNTWTFYDIILFSQEAGPAWEFFRFGTKNTLCYPTSEIALF